ncbi:Hsp70 family protein [Solimonas terrae]|uniref:Hsp70 family protein n=1 Tax=Solimonas terrae TaxID=1396819 RepID=A0A6M2BUA7_9GAMM|nr:Hsp70 family protein [Solimonas terrae]NGY05559.1 Hsp70 family protein [Solimonas terrae]
MTPYAAIDFGTSNSAVCTGFDTHCSLVPLEAGRDTMPTAVFYNADERTTVFGRQAIGEYQAGFDGRLLRSLKSLLGSELLSETTLVNGRPLAYREIIAGFLHHLRETAQTHCDHALDRVVLGRPVRFVDEHPERDRLAATTLADIARDVGFEDVHFQYEPIAAALDYEVTLDREALVLVADIGGGTSDFSLIRLGPRRTGRVDRSADVLANCGVHIAGTDFDQQLSLAAAMPALGLGTFSPGGKPVPSHVYFELATWHRINFLYTPRALAEAETLRPFFAEPALHDRLMSVLRGREGHRIAGLIEDAKVAVADGGTMALDLSFIDTALRVAVDDALLHRAIGAPVERIVAAALQTAADAGLSPGAVDAIYFTGGSTGVRFLREAIATAFAGSVPVMGDKFASVARGLGVYAGALFA